MFVLCDKKIYIVSLAEILEERLTAVDWKITCTGVQDYRPISNLCVATKIFEKCILKRIENLAAQGDLFTDKQHGFRKGRSTVSAARVLQREIAKAMDENNYIALASLDLS